ncbi:MAG: hypothetical protein IIB36_14310, partial [Gemmatimonadetes bacterium]|nr:hypothetical protein [Gemmatimonadota bacterium]
MSNTDTSGDGQTVRMLEEDIAVLRLQLQEAPQRMRLLEERLLDLRN